MMTLAVRNSTQITFWAGGGRIMTPRYSVFMEKYLAVENSILKLKRGLDLDVIYI